MFWLHFSGKVSKKRISRALFAHAARPKKLAQTACLALQKSRNPLRKAAFKWSERIPPLSVSRKSRAGASFPLDAHRRAWGKNRTFSGTPHFWKLSERVLQRDFAEVGPQLLLDRARQCALFRGELGAQPAGAVSAAVGDFRSGVNKPFARRHFGFPLRGRGWRIARDVAILRVCLPLRRKYFAVRQVWKRHIRHMRRRPRAALRFFMARVEYARGMQPRFQRQSAVWAQCIAVVDFKKPGGNANISRIPLPAKGCFPSNIRFFRVWTGQEG